MPFCAVCFCISAYAAVQRGPQASLAGDHFLTCASLLSGTLPVQNVWGDGAVSPEEKLGLPGGTALLPSEAVACFANGQTELLWALSALVCNVLILYKYFKIQSLPIKIFNINLLAFFRIEIYF